jgi:hypothetical protein
MYNMDISILGYKLNLEILILIGIVYLIMVGHTLCGCCNFYRLIEGMEGEMDASGNKLKQIHDAKQQAKAQLQANLPTQVPANTTTEGFVGANTNYGESSAYDLSDSMPVDTSSWSAQNMTVVPGQPLSEGVKKFLARKPQPVPLPEGEMLMFANTPFKPECCPNAYSTSTGCACMTGSQYNFLVQRGSNNVPYSEY